MSAHETVVETPRGEGRLVSYPAERPAATLLLSHGAGGGIGAGDLEALAEALPAQGITVALFEQPWRRAGRKVAGAPSTLDEAFTAAAGTVSSDVPLVVGGRSAGARSAARTARATGAAACLALSFPLHPPGRPERSRLEELTGAGVPVLVIQGERDAFGTPEEFPADLDLCVVPGADHSLKVRRSEGISQEQVWGIVVESTLEWVVREVAGNVGA